MSSAPDLPPATDGAIAAINLESARRRAWSRFDEDPSRPGLAEAVVEQELLSGQFLGDCDALDRLEALALRLSRDDASARASLVEAQVASSVHRFEEARRHLERAAMLGAPREAVERQSLAVDQATGVALDAVLDARYRRVRAEPRIENLVPLGALLADMDRAAEADDVYQQALCAYGDVSPFPLAWTCFLRGMLWGEQAEQSDAGRAAAWYAQAIEYLPGYTRARVHLAEICLHRGSPGGARALLEPVIPSGDPEVHWRMADALASQGRLEDAQAQLSAARLRFEELVGAHALAFADHAAEFYAGSGNDLDRALELARMNLANRPTRRALTQVDAITARL